MNKCVSLLFLCTVVFCCVFPALALDVNIVGEPETICEFQEGYALRQVFLNEDYVLMIEGLWNDASANNYEEGYTTLGTLYLYDITNYTLITIPGNIPSDKAQLTKNGTVYWLTPKYCIPNADQYGNPSWHTEFYSYTPGDSAPARLDVPGKDFVTDGHYFLSMQSDYWPRDITFTLSDLLTGEQKPLYWGGAPSPYVLLSGDYLVYYPDSSAGISDAVDQIHVYNLSSGTEDLLDADENGYFQNLRNLWGDTLVYELYDPVKKSYFTPPRLQMFNLRTQESESLVLPDGVYASRMYPPYAVLGEYDAVSDKIVIKLATLDMPPVVQPTAAASSTEQMALPESTRAGSPLAMTFGLIAFALACVLAVLWREK